MAYHNNSSHHEWEQQLYHQQQELAIQPSFQNGGEHESGGSGRGSGGGSSIPKPTRRRTRSSRRTPTTLLNANTSNFRALVQQFTGCPSPSPGAASLPCGGRIGIGKGPVNLNFGQGSVQNYSGTINNHHQQYDQVQERVHQRADDQQVMASSALNHDNDHDRSFGVSSEEPLLIDHRELNDLIAMEFFSIQNDFN